MIYAYDQYLGHQTARNDAHEETSDPSLEYNQAGRKDGAPRHAGEKKNEDSRVSLVREGMLSPVRDGQIRGD